MKYHSEYDNSVAYKEERKEINRKAKNGRNNGSFRLSKLFELNKMLNKSLNEKASINKKAIKSINGKDSDEIVISNPITGSSRANR